MTHRTVIAAVIAVVSYLTVVANADNHCASTRIGCCDDGLTVATTKNKKGCPPGKQLIYYKNLVAIEYGM